MSKEIIKALTDINKELSINKKLCDNLIGIDKKISDLEKSLTGKKPTKTKTRKQLKKLKEIKAKKFLKKKEDKFIKPPKSRKLIKPIDLLIAQEGESPVKEALGEKEVEDAIKESTLEITEKPAKKKPAKKKPAKKKPAKKKPAKKKLEEKIEDFLDEDIIEKNLSNDEEVLSEFFQNKDVVNLALILISILPEVYMPDIIEYTTYINNNFEDDKKRSRLARDEREGILDIIDKHREEADKEILSLLKQTLELSRREHPEEERQLIRTQQHSINPTVEEQTALNILQLPLTATPMQVRRRYRQLAKVHHPDKGGDAIIFERLENAYKKAEKYAHKRGGSLISDDELNKFLANVHREIRGGVLNMVNPFSSGSNLYNRLLASTYRI